MLEILSNRAVLHFLGKDAQNFLQRMTTNDIVIQLFSYNYLLTNQGKYLFDFFVFKESDESYFVEIDNKKVDEFILKLNLYKLRDDIEIRNLSNEYKVVYSKKPLLVDSISSNADPRFKLLGYRSIIKVSNINKLGEETKELYFTDKYNYAIPDGSTDLLYERSVPIEYGAEELSAINYVKGCYVGQEVISRAKYQGVIRKKIFKLISGTEIALIKSEAEITNINGDKIGIFCSGYKNQAIGLIREEKYLGLDKKIAMINDIKINILIPEWRK